MKKVHFTFPAVLALLYFFIAIFAPLLVKQGWNQFDLASQLSPPSIGHLMGQNHQGQDLLSLIILGIRVSLLIAFTTVTVSFLIGVPLGLISGYYGGKIDLLISRLTEVLLAFPGLLLAIAIAAILGPAKTNVVIALSISGWIPFARLVRAETLALKEREFVVAARVVGATDVRILLSHILINLTGILVVQTTFSFSSAILAESSLSFLGLGIPSNIPSLGKAISDGARYLLTAPHLAFFPGVTIFGITWAFNFLGDRLRDRIS